MILNGLRIFTEINGKVEQSPIQFVNEKQLNTIAKRIALT